MIKIIFLCTFTIILTACGANEPLSFEEYYVKDAQERGNDIEHIEVIATEEIDDLQVTLLASYDSNENHGVSLTIHEILPDDEGWADGNATGCDGPKVMLGYGEVTAFCGEAKEGAEIKNVTTDTGDDDKVEVFEYEDKQYWWMVNASDYDGDNIEITY